MSRFHSSKKGLGLAHSGRKPSCIWWANLEFRCQARNGQTLCMLETCKYCMVMRYQYLTENIPLANHLVMLYSWVCHIKLLNSLLICSSIRMNSSINQSTSRKCLCQCSTSGREKQSSQYSGLLSKLLSGGSTSHSMHWKRRLGGIVVKDALQLEHLIHAQSGEKQHSDPPELRFFAPSKRLLGNLSCCFALWIFVVCLRGLKHLETSQTNIKIADPKWLIGAQPHASW